MKKISFLLLLACTTLCCTEYISPDDFEAPDFPVVIGFLSPQSDRVAIYVGNAAPFGEIVDPMVLALSDALVSISDTLGNVAQLEFDPDRGDFTVSATAFPIVSGRLYRLSVAVSGLSLSAVCVVPPALPLKETTITQSGNETYLQAQWDDQPNVANHYRLRAQYIGTTVGYEVGWDNQCSQSATLYTDEGRDGQTIRSTLGSVSNYGCNGKNAILEGDSVRVQLLHTDENYHRYYTTAFAAIQSNGLGDPITVFTNIEGGGEGVFAAYSLAETTISPK
jgi:hypothetical protein